MRFHGRRAAHRALLNFIPSLLYPLNRDFPDEQSPQRSETGDPSESVATCLANTSTGVICACLVWACGPSRSWDSGLSPSVQSDSSYKAVPSSSILPERVWRTGSTQSRGCEQCSRSTCRPQSSTAPEGDSAESNWRHKKMAPQATVPRGRLPRQLLEKSFCRAAISPGGRAAILAASWMTSAGRGSTDGDGVGWCVVSREECIFGCFFAIFRIPPHPFGHVAGCGGVSHADAEGLLREAVATGVRQGPRRLMRRNDRGGGGMRKTLACPV